MTIRLSSLSKLETVQASAQARAMDDSDRVVVLIKLREGAHHPSYVHIRKEFSSRLYSAELRANTLKRLETDPAVESFSISRALPVIP